MPSTLTHGNSISYLECTNIQNANAKFIKLTNYVVFFFFFSSGSSGQIPIFVFCFFYTN